MTKLKETNCKKKIIIIVTKLINSNCDTTQKPQIVTKLKNSNCDKNQIVIKLKMSRNANCDQTLKLKLGQNSKTQIVTKPGL